MSKFERPSTFCKNLNRIPDIFLGGIEPSDIQQGCIGDCYLLGAISVMASQPKLIRKLIEPIYYNEEGVYTVNIFKDGVWNKVIIDDFLALTSGSFFEIL
jgi:hypothetical protein